MKITFTKIACLIFACYCIYYVTATLSKPKKEKKTKKEKSVSKTKVKLPSTDVYERELVVEDISAKSIIQNHDKYCEAQKGVRKFNSGHTLGYVTPWNGHGYDVAKNFAKFSMISPVWLQIQRKAKSRFAVAGTHDIDRKWLKDVKATNPKVQILPRVLFDGWHPNDFASLFASEDEIEDMTEEIVRVLLDHDMDGAVVEIWSQLPPKTTKDAIHVITHMKESFKSRELSLVLVIPPPVNSASKRPTSFTRETFARLEPHVDAFSLMTYDFNAGARKPGPNAPLSWMEMCVGVLDPNATARHKILTGLNFYGYKYTPLGIEPVVGNQFIQVMQNSNVDIVWDENTAEHIFQVDGVMEQAVISYPTLQSLHVRLELAKKLGTGIAIWDLGQGLDYFFDLL